MDASLDELSVYSIECEKYPAPLATPSYTTNERLGKGIYGSMKIRGARQFIFRLYHPSIQCVFSSSYLFGHHQLPFLTPCSLVRCCCRRCCYRAVFYFGIYICMYSKTAYDKLVNIGALKRYCSKWSLL